MLIISFLIYKSLVIFSTTCNKKLEDNEEMIKPANIEELAHAERPADIKELVVIY